VIFGAIIMPDGSGITIAWFVEVPMIVGIMAIERKEKRRSIGSSSP
jgi:hypothetical protein